MKNIGDGLSLLFDSDKSFNLTVDFGGDKNLNPSWCFHENFILSHHHDDHYNGILKCYKEKTGCWHLKYFYFPVMPKFPEKELFYSALFTINRYLNPNHPIQTTLISIIKKLNKGTLMTKTLKMGERIHIGAAEYTILWPPDVLTDKRIRKEIRNAINDFEEAKKEDKDLERIYEQIRDLPFEFSGELKDEIGAEYVKSKEITNPKVHKANESLKKAANRLSIAFKQGDNLLFLGDLEPKEIDLVVDNLKKSGDRYFRIIISAHHGTHFHKSLLDIKADIVLASVGETYRKKINLNYKSISNKFINTHDWGDIIVSKEFVVS